MCKKHIQNFYDDYQILPEYEDEGFTGGNTQRPHFQRLINDIKLKKVDVLICYRLDRISRSVADFSETLKVLDENNVAFISVSEKFDTSTPVGKAMLYMSSVFAQLERDLIAERIKDNLYLLAKKGSGRYLNGTAPEGFEKIQLLDVNEKRYSILQVQPEESEKIKLIFEKYLQFQSLNKVDVYLFQHDVRTRKKCKFNVDGINRILRHPIYATADEHTYEYFCNLGSDITNEKSDFDGKHGVNVFRRSGQGKGKIHQLNEPSKWVIGVGQHEGVISSEDWLRVQQILEQRGNLDIKKAHSHHGLLNGLLRCKLCGNYMRPYSIRKNASGDTVYHYVCQTKETSRMQKCKAKNIRGDILDKDVLVKIKALLDDSNAVKSALLENEKFLVEKVNKNTSKVRSINKEIATNQKAIDNLIKKLSKSSDDIIDVYLKDKIKELNSIVTNLKAELALLTEEMSSTEIERLNSEIIRDTIQKIKSISYDDSQDMLIKRNLLKTVVSGIYWDGKDVSIELL